MERRFFEIAAQVLSDKVLRRFLDVGYLLATFLFFSYGWGVPKEQLPPAFLFASSLLGCFGTFYSMIKVVVTWEEMGGSNRSRFLRWLLVFSICASAAGMIFLMTIYRDILILSVIPFLFCGIVMHLSFRKLPIQERIGSEEFKVIGEFSYLIGRFEDYLKLETGGGTLFQMIPLYLASQNSLAFRSYVESENAFLNNVWFNLQDQVGPERDSAALLNKVRSVRNNTFHGDKNFSDEQISRDIDILKKSILILRKVKDLDPNYAAILS